MIARLRGMVEDLFDDSIVVDVQGVGYQVFVDQRTRTQFELGTEVSLHVHTQVREDAITLYGFMESEDRTLFEKLLGVNKVGPRLALAALGGMEAQSLIQAIEQEDVATLTQIKGVGATVARRLTLELKGKLTGVVRFAPNSNPRASTPADQFSLALVRLGYKRSEINTALVGLKAQGLQDAPISERLSVALRILSRTE